MTLRQKQSLFASALGQLIGYAYAQGFELTMADGSIDLARKYRVAGSGKLQVGDDAVHMSGSLHYQRLAQDLNLFVGGKWISNGSHPAWADLGRYWESLHQDARWGGPFQDANHFSFAHGGKK